jgi:thiopeptide-type bacteriocin biosynthesis protein
MEQNWISAHVFYAAAPTPLLLEGVAPLVDELRRRKLIQRYFFIRYWLEGSHVRLRLLPAEGVAPEAMKAVLEPAIEDFLRRRPALYRYDDESHQPFYKTLFVGEYGEEKWWETYPDGRMPFRPNNSLHYIAYEPEYHRYGGPAGVEVAEWHFEHSSDAVLRILGETNAHVRPILLGQSVRLTLPFLYTFLEDDARVELFLRRYVQYWQQAYHKELADLSPFDKPYARLAEELRQRIDEIRRHVVYGQPAALLELDRAWLEHLRELRVRLEKLVDSQELVLPDAGGAMTPVSDRRDALNRLMGSYIHMMNNRMGVGTGDETYLAYLLQSAVREQLAVPAEVV